MEEEKEIKNDSNNKAAVNETGNVKVEEKNTNQAAGQAVAKSVFGMKRRFPGKMRSRRDEKKEEFEQRILDIARVTRVMAGGKRMSFRATVAIGDKKGKVGVGLGKGADVTFAVTKAVNQAKKNLIDVQMVNDTIAHEIFQKFGAAKILFKPASQGRGVIAGGVVRVILELAGIKNVTSKILGTNNKVNNSKCTIEALKRIKRIEVREKKKDSDQLNNLKNK